MTEKEIKKQAESWATRRERYLEEVRKFLEEMDIGLFGERLSLLAELSKDGHHPWFDEHVLSITLMFLKAVSTLRYEPVDEKSWENLRQLMEEWPGKKHVREYKVVCDASVNPPSLVDDCCVRARFGLRLAGMWAEFGLTVGAQIKQVGGGT